MLLWHPWHPSIHVRRGGSSRGCRAREEGGMPHAQPCSPVVADACGGRMRSGSREGASNG